MRSTRLRAAGAAIRTLVAAVLLILTTASATGCGQRGPLYLPETEPGVNSQAAAGDVEPKPDSTGQLGTDQSADRDDSR